AVARRCRDSATEASSFNRYLGAPVVWAQWAFLQCPVLPRCAASRAGSKVPAGNVPVPPKRTQELLVSQRLSFVFTLALLVAAALPASVVTAQSAVTDAARTFPETGYSISDDHIWNYF